MGDGSNYTPIIRLYEKLSEKTDILKITANRACYKDLPDPTSRRTSNKCVAAPTISADTFLGTEYTVVYECIECLDGLSAVVDIERKTVAVSDKNSFIN